MALTANVVANTPITATWGNEIRNRTVQVFATSAERAAQWAAPPTGATSTLVDTPGVLWVYNGTLWEPVNGLGVLSYVEKTTNQTAFGQTATDVSGLTTAALTIGAGRRTEIAAELSLSRAAPDGTNGVVVAITDSANAVQVQRIVQPLAPGFEQVNVSRTLSLAGGSYTFKVRITVAISGFVNVAASATEANWLRVTDLGPI